MKYIDQKCDLFRKDETKLINYNLFIYNFSQHIYNLRMN